MGDTSTPVAPLLLHSILLAPTAMAIVAFLVSTVRYCAGQGQYTGWERARRIQQRLRPYNGGYSCSSRAQGRAQSDDEPFTSSAELATCTTLVRTNASRATLSPSVYNRTSKLHHGTWWDPISPPGVHCPRAWCNRHCILKPVTNAGFYKVRMVFPLLSMDLGILGEHGNIQYSRIECATIWW